MGFVSVFVFCAFVTANEVTLTIWVLIFNNSFFFFCGFDEEDFITFTRYLDTCLFRFLVDF